MISGVDAVQQRALPKDRADRERKRAAIAGGGGPPKSRITGPGARSPARRLHFLTEPQPPDFELLGSLVKRAI